MINEKPRKPITDNWDYYYKKEIQIEKEHRDAYKVKQHSMKKRENKSDLKQKQNAKSLDFNRKSQKLYKKQKVSNDFKSSPSMKESLEGKFEVNEHVADFAD